MALVISEGKCGDHLIHLETSVGIDTSWATESPRVGGTTWELIGYQISCSCSSGKIFLLGSFACACCMSFMLSLFEVCFLVTVKKRFLILLFSMKHNH